jgi:hypothetical protein
MGLTPQTVSAMTLAGLYVDFAGTLGARIYDASTQALVASGSMPVSPGSNEQVSVPISATLMPLQKYMVAFYVSDNGNGGSGTLYQLSLPYNVGPFTVSAIGESPSDAYPSNQNIYAPNIILETCN